MKSDSTSFEKISNRFESERHCPDRTTKGEKAGPVSRESEYLPDLDVDRCSARDEHGRSEIMIPINDRGCPRARCGRIDVKSANLT